MAASDDRARDGTIKLADGRVLGYREYGDVTGIAVVYLHGMPGVHHSLDVMRVAGKKHRAISGR